MKVALIGCGFIGSSLAEFIEQEMKGSMELVAVYDEVKERAASLCRKLRIEPRIAENSDDIIHDSTVNLVIEAASQKAAKAIIPKALTAGKHVMVMSVGALADSELYEEIEKMLRKSEAKIHVPSGAIGGLDWIKAASTACGFNPPTHQFKTPPRRPLFPVHAS